LLLISTDDFPGMMISALHKAAVELTNNAEDEI